MIHELATVRKEVGLKINLKKIEILLTDASKGNVEIEINGAKIENTENLIYLR